jgi:hypothetical protein
MARKHVIFSATALAVGVFTLSAPFHERDQAGSVDTHKRQFIDENLRTAAGRKAALQAQTAPQTAKSVMPATAQVVPPAPHDPIPGYDLDVPYLEVAFGLPQLNSLMTDGQAELSLPGIAPMMLTLVKHNKDFGVDRLSVRHADAISTITRRGDQFFATLALPQGGYRMDGWGNTSRLYPHQILAQRTLRHEVDYRHVP